MVSRTRLNFCREILEIDLAGLRKGCRFIYTERPSLINVVHLSRRLCIDAIAISLKPGTCCHLLAGY